MTCHTESIQCLDTYQLGAVSGEEERIQRDFKMHTGSPNGSAGAVSGDGEFVVLGLPVYLRRLNISFDI